MVRPYITVRPISGPREPPPNRELVMSDNKKKVGKPDRDRVSNKEPYEPAYLAKKHELPLPLVKKVIDQVGPMRDDVEKKLTEMKKNRK